MYYITHRNYEKTTEYMLKGGQVDGYSIADLLDSLQTLKLFQ